MPRNGHEGEQSIRINRTISPTFLEISKSIFDAAYDLEVNWGGIEKVIQLAAEGNGTVINYSHSKKVDPLLGIRKIREIPGFENTLILAPYGLHQKFPGMESVGSLYNVESMPLITDSTIKKNPHRSYPTEQIVMYLNNYINRAKQVLKAGGIVLVAPQATRKPRLGDPTEAASVLIKRLVRDDINKVTFFSLGIHPSRNTNPGIHLRAKFTLTGGTAYQISDLNHMIDTFIDANGVTDVSGTDLKRRMTVEEHVSPYIVDHVVFAELAKVVPPSYQNPPTA